MLLKNLGKYEIINWLGGGRFGDVFLARDTILDKQFAIKIARMRKEEISMLKDEAKLLARLNHPNIVRFYNIDLIDKKFVLVMEYVKGQTLRSYIEEKGMNLSDFTTLATQILDGLGYAHTNNVLHRDIKPENILTTKINDKLHIKITDFGLASFIRADAISASIAGTPIYMSPEAWAGKFDTKSDIWSIGVIFYELITGVPPFLADNLNTLHKKIKSQKFIMPGVLRPDTPDQIETAIVQCLNFDPRARPSCAELYQKIAVQARGLKIKSTLTLPAQKKSELKLTPAQQAVLKDLDNRILLLGQAGTGKTTTLIYAVNELIKKGVPLSKILICTFTNKATNDIRKRLNILNPSTNYELWLGTVHTLAFRILCRDAARLNIGEDFLVEQPKKIFTEMKVKTGKYQLPAVINFIEKLKAQAITPEQFAPQGNWQEYCHLIYQQYQEYLREKNILDFDDLIIYAYKLLKEYDDLQIFYRSLFEYIFVDELQDINPAQYRLISMLTRDRFFFTGDPDQAIYGWRGAERDIIFQVPKQFKDLKLYNLTRSFRLPQSIIEIANSMMLRTSTAISTATPGEVLVYAAQSEKDEAQYVVKEIKKLIKQNFRYQNIALLYRANYLSLVYEEALLKTQIPHTVIGGRSFYERADIKPLIEYLEYLKQNIDKKTGNKSAQFIARSCAFFKLKKAQKKRAEQIFEYHLKNAQNLSLFHIIKEIIDITGLQSDNIYELLQLAKELSNSNIQGFLDEIKLLQELDLTDWGKDTVKLMTVHSAKGLEFPVVFVVDLAENIFPLTKKISAQNELDEERRLCYVALTRAQQRLYLLFPKRRHGYLQQPSRFLVDMFNKKSFLD